jgi:FkbM family methyltransferase
LNLANLIWWIGKIPVCGGLLRAVARSFKEGSIVQISTGHAAGYLWKRHRRYVNGYWVGHYELPIQEALVRSLGPGMVFFDIGANAGFFTLVGAKRVGSSGRVVAFDPMPENIDSIREQIELNNLKNCRAELLALGEVEGVAPFCFDRPGSSIAHLGSPSDGEQSIDVRVTTLDSISENNWIPDFIKMDVEGAEVRVLEGARRLLREKGPGWLIELHGSECTSRVISILEEHGYKLYSLEGSLIADEEIPSHIIACRQDAGIPSCGRDDRRGLW